MKAKLNSLYEKWNKLNINNSKSVVDLSEYPIVYCANKRNVRDINDSRWTVIVLKDVTITTYGLRQTVINSIDEYMLSYFMMGNSLIICNDRDLIEVRTRITSPTLMKLLFYETPFHIIKSLVSVDLYTISSALYDKRSHKNDKNVRQFFGFPLDYMNRNISSRIIKELYQLGLTKEEIIKYRYVAEVFLKLSRSNIKLVIQCYNNLCPRTISNPVFWTYRDYLRMRISLHESNTIKSKDFPLTFTTSEKLKQYHDRINIIYTANANKIKSDRFDISYKYHYSDAKKFEFSDDEYSVIACKSYLDLVNEGTILKHCVASYANSVSNGKEYILFLRKNSDLETPFFTIDVLPSLKVRQIHGLCNCNISDEIKPFIKKWATKYNLDISSTCGVYCHL